MPAQNPQDLAPAAGKGIGKEIAADLTSRAEFIGEMAETARGALQATTRRWDPGSKSWIVEPDYRTRTAMFFGLLAHMEGEPVKRILIEKRDGTMADPMKLLEESPALQRAAADMLARAANRGKNPRPAKYPRAVELTIED